MGRLPGITYSGEMTNGAEGAAGSQVELFAAPAGRWLGLAAIVIAVAATATLAYGDPVQERRSVFFCVAFVAVVWVVMVRPAVAVHEHGALLRNMLRDTFVPSSAITQVRLGQMLEIKTMDEVHRGLGISRSARSVMRGQRPRPSGFGMFGTGQQLGAQSTGAPGSGADAAAPSYLSYVESRLERLGSEAAAADRRLGQEASAERMQSVVAWSRPAVAALSLAGLSLLLALLT